MVDIPSPTLDTNTAAYLKHNNIRSICLFKKNVETATQLQTLCTDLRDLLGEDTLIAIDHEGGAILRPTFWPFAPSAMSLGATDDPALTQQVNAALARQLRSVGINWNFTPVLDLNINPANPVIGERSFGANADLVVRQGRAALLGHDLEKVAACVKHFPGHGDTHIDSHYALPRVQKTRAELDKYELLPFRELLPITPAIMTSHIIFDALDTQYPATLSHSILTGLLREEWGYDGVIVTDSMGMKAIDDNYGRGEAGVLALQAGSDLVMALGRLEAQEATLKAMQDAFASGALKAKTLEASLTRLHKLAQRYPVQVDLSINTDLDARLFEEAWARGISAYRQPQPPRLGTEVVLVAQRSVNRENVSEGGIDADMLVSDLSQLYKVTLHSYETPADLDWAAVNAAGRLVILATASRHRHPQFVGLKPDLHLALYNPYAVLDVDAPALVTYGFRPEARAAVMQWFRGQLTPNKKLPFVSAYVSA